MEKLGFAVLLFFQYNCGIAKIIASRIHDKIVIN